jgi:hypothetical protein
VRFKTQFCVSCRDNSEKVRWSRLLCRSATLLHRPLSNYFWLGASMGARLRIGTSVATVSGCVPGKAPLPCRM